MDQLEQENKRELELLAIIVKLSFQKGWITENERLQIQTKRTLNKKRSALLEVLKNLSCDEIAAKILCAIRCINEMDPPTNPDTDDNYFLTTIMARLFEKALITREEKLDFESQMKVEIPNKNTCAEEFDISGTSLDKVQEERIEEKSVCEKNPIQLGPVIRCILQYLDFKEIKNCRLISKEWASVALNLLTTRSKIRFAQRTENGNNSERNPVQLFKIFPEKQNEIIPFTSFAISGCDNHPWTIEELNYFFRNQQKFIRELELSEICLVDDRWEHVESYDITPWVKNSPITVANAKHNTKLSVVESIYITINLSALVNIKELELKHCTIILEEGIRINPIKLELEDVTFIFDGNKLPEFCVNDIVDFSRTKYILLKYDSETEASKLSLELDDNDKFKLDYLELVNVNIKNWRTCRWIVNELVMENNPFTERTGMEIKELCFNDSRIDLSLLPQSLQILKIAQIDEGTCICFQPVVLRNLKCLDLDFDANCFSTFSQYFECPNLVELELQQSSDFEMLVDLAWIPKTVKILKLREVTIKNERNENLSLDKLILNSYTPLEMKGICGTHIQAKELVLYFGWDTSRADVEFLEFLEYQKSCRDCGQRIFVGSFEWDEYSFDASPLRDFVDKKAEYYVFEDQIGKAFDLDEFKKLLESDPELSSVILSGGGG